METTGDLPGNVLMFTRRNVLHIRKGCLDSPVLILTHGLTLSMPGCQPIHTVHMLHNEMALNKYHAHNTVLSQTTASHSTLRAIVTMFGYTGFTLLWDFHLDFLLLF